MKPRKLLTLCLIVKDHRVLLGMKKRGFGEGHWNGFGGKVEPGEEIESAAKREVFEEAGVTLSSAEKTGVLNFEFESDPEKLLEVHVFRSDVFTGEPIETEEMRPQWFAFDEIPYDKMWSDDAYWLPLLLKGKKFEGYFLFDKPSSATYQAKIVRQELTVK
ncbi:MAG: 8-oxo-dGTP diphosphatase [Patescibacteria group bacterium]